MSKVEYKVNKEELRDKVAKNLGMNSADMGSYIHTLVDGLSDVTDKVTEEVNKHIANMYLDTADEDTLETYGLIKGVPRLKSRLAFSRSQGAEISIQPHFFIYTKNLNLKLFNKGDTVDVDIMRITFLEDVHYNSNLQKVFVSCEISIGNTRAISTSFLKEGQTFSLPVPTNFKSLFSELTLNIETPMGFTDHEEDLESYRTKLKALASSENLASYNTLDKIISSSKSIYKYFIDKSTYPVTIYYMSPVMYYNENVEPIVQQVEHYLRLHTDVVRGYTSNFEFSLPEKVEFRMNIVTTEDSKLREVLEDFLATFVTKHTIGYDFVLDKEYLNEFFRVHYPEFNQFFEVEFYYTDGLSVTETEDKHRLVIKSNAYPKLHAITINGDYSDVEPYI